MLKKIALSFVFACYAMSVLAADIPEEKQKLIQGTLSGLFGVGKPNSMVKSALPGFYEIFYGSTIVYVSEDGRYVFVNGNVIDSVEKRNLTEESESQADRQQWPSRKASLDNLGENSMIVFKAPEEKHVISVFTDIDCGYCRKLHAEIDQYLNNGITVRYLFFPRAGLNSSSYDKAVSVWCADDQKKTLTTAKARRSVPKKTCDNPIKKHMQMVQSFSLTGTPAIVLSSGQLLAGYVPAPKLSKLLDSIAQ